MKYAIFFVVLLGCVDNGNLWIASECIESDHAVVYEAVEKLNAALGREEITISGVRDVDYSADFANDEYDTVMCVYDDDEITLQAGVAGKNIWGDIILMSYRLRSRDQRVSVMMHELVHYVADNGLREDEHTDIPDTIMYPMMSTPPITEYVESDLEGIR